MPNHDDDLHQEDEEAENSTPLRISLAMPAAFDGLNGSFKDWIRRYEQCALAAGWSASEQATRLGLYLKEPFLSGWDAYAKKKNFEDDKKTLLKIFDHVRPHQALKQFQDMRWAQGQHPALYAAALQRQLNRYYTKESFPEFDDATKAQTIQKLIIDRLKADLPPMVRFQLLLSDPKTVEEACVMCDSVLALDDPENPQEAMLPPAPRVATAAGVLPSRSPDDSNTPKEQDKHSRRIEQKMDRILQKLEERTSGPSRPPPGNPTVAAARPRHCGLCKSIEHPTYECPNKKFAEGCYLCGRTGHLARDCYQNPNRVVRNRPPNPNGGSPPAQGNPQGGR